MLTYTYSCPHCGEFETQQRMSDEALKVCPSCSASVHRLLTGGSAAFVKSSAGGDPECGQATRCCGREERCDTPGCGK